MHGFTGLKSIGSFPVPAGVKCFLQNTKIETLRGDRTVEHLDVGDFVKTPEGDWVAVEWVGFKKVAPKLTNPRQVNPICVKAGALGENVPCRDLFVSPDHGLLVDGMMIDARVLVNGRSIFQVGKVPLEGFYYFHVETEDYMPFLAENAPSESYIWPKSIAEMEALNESGPLACESLRISSTFYLPDTVKTMIRARAVKLGAFRGDGHTHFR